MIEISSANESVIVSEIIGDAPDQDSCPESSKPSDRTSSPLPSLDSLSISTGSSTYSNNAGEDTQKAHTEDASETIDCSSSVSSQDSSQIGSIFGPNSNPKRSFFSKYWQKTGQTPVPLRPLKNLSTQDLLRNSSHLLSSTDEELDEASISSLKSSSSPFSLDEELPPSVTDAELLEDDGESSFLQDEGDAHQNFFKASETPPSDFPQPQRRRSILPPAPTSHPALRATSQTQTRSWRKSASLSCVEEYSRRTQLDAQHKTQSMPGMRSSFSGSLMPPGPSILRTQSRYSSDASLQSLSSAPMLQRRLSRSGSSVSSTSSVSFLDAVDIRHFDPPKETYSGKGWSEYYY